MNHQWEQANVYWYRYAHISVNTKVNPKQKHPILNLQTSDWSSAGQSTTVIPYTIFYLIRYRSVPSIVASLANSTFIARGLKTKIMHFHQVKSGRVMYLNFERHVKQCRRWEISLWSFQSYHTFVAHMSLCFYGGVKRYSGTDQHINYP